ncbi:MAG: TonB family protein [Hydrogenophilales bacterium]|nr:TonB family protein [Hydrogenophilales bacterium]
MLNMKPSIKNSQTKRPQSTFQLMMRVAMWCAISLGGIATNAYALSPDQIFDKVKDSIVVVKVYDENVQQLGLGSGVVLPSGKIGTNCHVVEGARLIAIENSTRISIAYLVAGDEAKDICVLQAFPPIGKPAVIGNTTKLRIGERVFAVGAPEGLELTFSEGLVSGIRDMLIQTSAPISSGSSGGGLFDTNGRLLGLTTLMHKRGQNLNFAIPVDWVAYAKPVLIDAELLPPPIDDEAPEISPAYIDSIQMKIRGLLRLPPKLAGNPEVVYHVAVFPNGEIRKIVLQKSSGYPAYDSAVERAISGASPLPLSPDKNSKQFINGITLNFRYYQ